MITLTTRQEQRRVAEIDAQRTNFMEKTKASYYDDFVRLYEARKDGRKTDIHTAAYVGLGGVSISVFFLQGFSSGACATLSASLGFYLYHQATKLRLYDEILEIFHQRPEIQAILKDWKEIKRRTEDRDYARSVWAEENGLCEEGEKVSVKSDEDSEEVYLVEYPWSIWIGMYEQDKVENLEE